MTEASAPDTACFRAVYLGTPYRVRFAQSDSHRQIHTLYERTKQLRWQLNNLMPGYASRSAADLQLATLSCVQTAL